MICPSHRAALLVSAALLGAAPAAARTEIHPYIEVQQVFNADLSGHDQDFVTYTGLSAGVDATIDTRDVHGQVDYRYDHYFSWSHKYRDTDVHQGVGVVSYQPNSAFSFDAGGIATRARGSLGQRTPGFLFGDVDNTNQVYAIDLGPRYSDHFGDLNVSASYDFGWTKSTDGQGEIDLGPGQPVLDNNFSTTSHTVLANVGMRPGGAGLPIGWSVSGGYLRDDINFLGARSEDKFARADVTLPVTDSLALTGGVGYEDIRASQDAILTDADGNAILTRSRHLQADKSAKRLLSYDQDGLIWDVGIIWRPSARTFVELHGGKRYGGTIGYGRIEHQFSESTSMQVVAYSDVQSFGRQLTRGLDAFPTNFSSPSTPFPSTLNLCVFGTNGGNGACLPALSSVNPNFYRSRGVYANISGSRGLWQWGIGASYDWRRYLAPGATGDVFTFDGVHDQSASINGVLTRKLSPVSSVSGTALATWYDTDAFDTSSYVTYGAALTYFRSFSNHLSGSASVSVSSGSGAERDDDVFGTAALAIRYQM